MPSEPRRLGHSAKAVSERSVSLITRTSPSTVRAQDSQRLQRGGLMKGPEVRGRCFAQRAVRETEVEVLADCLAQVRLLARTPKGRIDPERTLAAISV